MWNNLPDSHLRCDILRGLCHRQLGGAPDHVHQVGEAATRPERESEARTAAAPSTSHPHLDVSFSLLFSFIFT